MSELVDHLNSGTTSEPGTPPSDLEDGSVGHPEFHTGGKRHFHRETPPRQSPRSPHSGSLDPTPPGRPESEDVAATLMILMGGSAATTKGGVRSPSPVPEVPLDSRKRPDECENDRGPPKRLATGAASRPAPTVQPHGAMPLIAGNGYPQYQLQPTQAAMAHARAMSHGWCSIQASQQQQLVSLSHAVSITAAAPPLWHRSNVRVVPALQLAFPGPQHMQHMQQQQQQQQQQLQALPGAASLGPPGWARSAFHCVNLARQHPGTATAPTLQRPQGSIDLDDQRAELQVPTGGSSSPARNVPQSCSKAGQLQPEPCCGGPTEAATPAETAPAVCPLCKTGAEDSGSAPADECSDGTTQPQQTQQTQQTQPLQRRKRTMSRKRNWYAFHHPASHAPSPPPLDRRANV
jgi:hypothetical protein